jgi:shikimate kinase
MGAGKSSVGKLLAALTPLTLYDTDHEIMDRTGVKISWIFEIEKEAGFRKREAEIIDELTQLENIILSTGGGCVVTPINLEHLKNRGTVVYLHVNLKEQLRRTKRTETRPLLEVADPKAKLIELNTAREPLYEEIADITIKTSNKKPIEIAKEILSKM